MTRRDKVLPEDRVGLFHVFLVLLWLVFGGPANGATLVSKATGNFTAAGTWGVAEAGASALQTTRTASTNTTTSYVYSSAFTCTNLDVVEGVLVFGTQLGTTGTVSVALSDDNGVTATKELAINATDLNTQDSTHFFLFASTLTCDGGADYKVGVKSSTSAQAKFYRDGTAGNWFRVLRTTTTAAPGATDLLYTNGDLTGAGTGNNFTVTMDNTATTSFGTVAATASLGVGVRGTVTWGTAASTNYYLKLKGLAIIFAGGTWNMGTSGTPIPSTSTAVLEFDSTSNVDSGFIAEAGSTVNFYGATKTVINTLLNTDEAAASTVIGVASTSGWLVSDELAFAPTTRTATEGEKKTILTVDSGVQVTLTAGLTNAHSGTSPTQAEVVNLTRNVKIRGISSSLQGFILARGTSSTTTLRYTQVYNLGSNTTDKHGIEIQYPAVMDMQFCSLHEFEVAGSKGWMLTGTDAAGVTISNNGVYRTQNNVLHYQAVNGGLTFSGNTVAMGGIGVSPAIIIYNNFGNTVITNNVLAGGGQHGINFDVAATVIASPGSLNGNTIHSNNGKGISLNGASGTITGLTAWRNNDTGVDINRTIGITIDSYTGLGNSGSNIRVQTGAFPSRLNLLNCTLNGDTTFSTARGVDILDTTAFITMHSCDLGTASGIKTTHTTGDIVSTQGYDAILLTGSNNKFSSATPLSWQGVLQFPTSYVKVSKYDQTAADHRAYYPHGNIRYDATTVRGSLPSQRATPASATIKLESGPWRVPVLNGATVPATAWVRKSTAADSCGANYNGSQVRLIVRRNDAAGITSDTVLDTSTVAVGNWEQLSGTTAAVTDNATLEFFADGDGTVGCFYVESGLYWIDGLPNPSGVGGGAPAGGAAGGGPSSYVAQAEPRCWFAPRGTICKSVGPRYLLWP